ncbi:xanthine dehydrogenase family protein molybdopterin-binding subunit [candidate division KSB1 bacterium]|nr:xanthine dehydrogenase family protein molybdopterin-binding subunit [candidate division KSB1 bacterium]NIR70955.1 xanthine dehydrogenase family protein molybdopterin-binding subunit [candidate division KSB1 bacterium]NIS24691.1 xanthine dehydrogenase family protein molybdopterin-binding subunit [candidate division KSB1 bacterium]NIT71600.1 xanthine dehydrogenase family protein molybdopterin-binding subunit [candidate division KSB1 bacterium]NIU25304.1 xanthine dehydrogenase family protein mo
MPRKIVKSKYFIEENFVETLAEVPTEDVKPWESDEELKVVGKPISRVDGYDKVSGSATYMFDVILPNMVHAKTLRCPFPHAKIRRIDTSRAKKLPGVLDIITHANTPEITWYRDTSRLFDPHLRYEGDEIACVAAKTEHIAEQALKQIEVEYEELPFAIDPGQAMKDGAARIHDWGNILRGKPATYERGDVKKGFSEAEVVVEEEFSTQVAIHNPTEVHGSVVNWDGDYLTIWDSTQAVFRVRDTVATSLNIPSSHVRVIKKYMGGGFGSKLFAGKYTVMAALLAKRIGRPVKITLDRREMNLAVGNRPDSVQKLKIGAKNDGTLVAMTHYSYGSSGAYPSGAGCSWPLRTLYKCPNVSTEEYTVMTNAGAGRPFRAPGHVQGTFAFESILDDIAEKLNMDPIEFRLKNYTDIDQVQELPYTSKRLREAYEKGARAIGWSNRKQTPGSDSGPIKRGIGMASQIWWGGGGPPAYATLKLNRDGSAHVLAGTQDIGTGTYTFMAQVTAEVLEIPVDKIQITLGDTDACPYCPLSGGSMTAPSVSPAVRHAAEQMKDKLISGAGAIWNVPEAQLRYAKGVISAADDGSKQMPISDVIKEMKEQVLITTGARAANPEGYAINSFGAQFADVEVNIETGKVRVLKIVAAHDVGRVLNHKTMENQFHGGVMQGLSFALMEERIIDEATGKVLTTNLHTYKLPTIMDMPEIEVIIVSESDPLISNTGVKGIGEPAIIPTAGAIANAIYNATGVRMKSTPMTPDKVLMALNS